MIDQVQLVWGASSDRGLRRAVNEDSYIAAPPVFLVADGMGGHDAGEVASATALDGFRPLVGLDAVTLDDVVAAFEAAVRGVGAIPVGRFAAGTTLTGVAVSEHNGVTYWLVMNLGDSRTYRLTPHRLEQVSVDHSAVQELVDAGALRPAEADRHPDRNVITKAIGAGSRADPDYWFLPATTGDRLLVCSDGLTRELGHDRIELVLREEAAPQNAAMRLVHEALLHGGRDNVTVVVVDAVSVRSDDDGDAFGDTVPTYGHATIPRAEAPSGRSTDASL